MDTMSQLTATASGSANHTGGATGSEALTSRLQPPLGAQEPMVPGSTPGVAFAEATPDAGPLIAEEVCPPVEAAGPKYRTVQKRIKRCGKCKGCRAPNCGECRPCKNMKEFGGSGTRKQACSKKRCVLQVGEGNLPHLSESQLRRLDDDGGGGGTKRKKGKGVKPRRAPTTVMLWDTKHNAPMDTEKYEQPHISQLSMFLRNHPRFEVYDGQDMRPYEYSDYEEFSQSEDEEIIEKKEEPPEELHRPPTKAKGPKQPRYVPPWQEEDDKWRAQHKQEFFYEDDEGYEDTVQPGDDLLERNSSKSGFVGVQYNPQASKHKPWKVVINGKYLGYYTTALRAARARRNALTPTRAPQQRQQQQQQPQNSYARTYNTPSAQHQATSFTEAQQALAAQLAQQRQQQQQMSSHGVAFPQTGFGNLGIPPQFQQQ